MTLNGMESKGMDCAGTEGNGMDLFYKWSLEQRCLPGEVGLRDCLLAARKGEEHSGVTLSGQASQGMGMELNGVAGVEFARNLIGICVEYEQAPNRKLHGI